jgi:ABC-type Fe3+ transport system permease subunit
MTALLIAALAMQICYPFAIVLRERRRARHSYIDGQQLVFTGSAWNLLGKWIKWLLLSIVTLGIYLFWVGPRLQRWVWEHTDLASLEPGSASQPRSASAEG